MNRRSISLSKQQYLTAFIALFVLLILTKGSVYSQTANVGIGTTSPVASAQLELSSTTKGLLIPRMTQAQRDAIASPATGLLVYVTDSISPAKPATFYYYSGTAWLPFLSTYSGWLLSGNSGTNPSNNYLGTSDAQDMVLRSNATERVRVYSGGNVLLGNSNNTAEELRFQEPSGSGSDYTSFIAGAQSANISYTLPTAQGVYKSYMENDGSGALRWVGEHHYNVSTPTTITGNTNNWNLSADGAFFRVASTAAVNVTGIQNGTDGRVILLVNIGTNTITLQNLNAGSAAANRIIVRPGAFGGGAIAANGGYAFVIYDAAANSGNGAWRLLQ